MEGEEVNEGGYGVIRYDVRMMGVQVNIFRALAKICPDAKMEDTAKGGHFSIDMTFRDARGRLVAVEVGRSPLLVRAIADAT
jgi:hypothetical protein